MATATGARTMSRYLAILLLATIAYADITATPSNASLTDVQQSSKQILRISSTTALPMGLPMDYDLVPLTAGAGLDNPGVSQINFEGTMLLGNESNQNNVSINQIFFVSCDPSPGFLDPSSVVNTLGSQNPRPRSILLYSETAQLCNISGTARSESLYTLISMQASQALAAVLQAQTLRGQIYPNRTAQGNPNSQTSNQGGPAPTTAVAMSILYSITGIITLLFLVIIATGAIRAHRHPERYGPRTGATGGPRQSRAKGLARAMLATLPIVKFGDPEPVKPESRDIELGDGHSVHRTESTTTPESTGALKTIPPAAVVESGMNSESHGTSSTGNKEEPTATEGELGCSICTEDFKTGEDVRVLPCKHKYHPACIDPWLLNVSGTCPLCRHDLRPSPAEGAEGTVGEGDELPPPLSPTEGADGTTPPVAGDAPQRRRISRLLDATHLRSAPADERMAALRNLREQSVRDGTTTTEVEESSRRARLRDVFRIRTRQQAPQ